MQWLAAIRAILLVGVIALVPAFAQQVVVDADIKVESADAGEVVVWLEPLALATPVPFNSTKYKLVQRDHRFVPHLLVVPVGAAVDFPNHDIIFHNVFSLFQGKRFDLGLYEAGTSRQVRFDRSGVSYIFCNIHKQMSAIVIALKTPYFGVRKKDGLVRIPNVPYGAYVVHVWAEGAGSEEVADLEREVFISSTSHSLEAMTVTATSLTAEDHKNKYGHDYPATATNPLYPH